VGRSPSWKTTAWPLATGVSTDMRVVSASQTVNRREDRLLRERLAAMDAKVDVLVKEVGASAPCLH
jgi:hypothetical protein